MIPLRDRNPSASFPAVTLALIVVNVLVFLWELTKARVVTVIPPFFLGPFFELPAVLFLGWWFFIQFFNGALSLSAGQGGLGGIAWWAHVGGFVFALAVTLFMPPRTRRRRREEDD